MKKLNLGSGNDYLAGYVNVDNNIHCRADVVHDLNSYPYPFNDHEFDEIFTDHLIEHLDDPLDFLQEIYRISKDGAKIVIKCPHFSCNWIHPRHKSAISTKLFDFIDKDNSEYYQGADFVVGSVRLKWLRNTSLGKRKKPIMKLLNFGINFLANLNIVLAERIWCYWVGGFEEIIFEAKARKIAPVE
jgi:SAM-dependent methyltransferase